MKGWFTLSVCFLPVSVAACSTSSMDAIGYDSAGPLESEPATGTFDVSWNGGARTALLQNYGARVKAKEAFMGSPSQVGIWAGGIGTGKRETVGFQVLHEGAFPEKPFDGTYEASLDGNKPHQVALYWNDEVATSGTITLTQGADRRITGHFAAQFDSDRVEAEFDVTFDSLFCLIAPENPQPIGEAPDGTPLWSMQVDEEQSSSFCKAAKALVKLEP